MAKSRAEYVTTFCELVGGPTVARVIDARDGWPGLIEVQVGGVAKRFSLHVGPIHPMARGKAYEFRFQNPGQNRPVMTLAGTEPLLIGIWDEDEPNVFVAAEAELRLGDLTRFSVLFPERLFRGAQEFGWAEPYPNNNGDLHWSFLPHLLPSFIELNEAGVRPASKDMQIAIAGAGLVEQPTEPAAAARARAAATRLIRDAKFGKTVVSAYDNRCAMCGLNMGLVAGAHIFPVSAAGSSDQPSNGLALCENHHRAFDNHWIWVDPATKAIKVHPAKQAASLNHERDKLFVESTFSQLVLPLTAANAPDSKMFEERYAYFDGLYEWA